MGTSGVRARARRRTLAGLVALVTWLGALPVAALACVIALDLPLPSPSALTGAEPDYSPPPCTRRYPGALLDLRDDLPCAESMVHVFNDPFFGSDLDIEGDLLVAGSWGEGFRIYSIAEPERPRLLATHHANTGLHTDPEAARFGDRTLVAFSTSVAYPGTDPFGPRAEFVDISDPAHPRKLATLPGDSHNGELVAQRRWYLPSRLGFTHDALETPLRGPGLELYDVSPVLEDPPRPPQLIACADGVPCHEPDKLWNSSPFRGANEPTTPHPARIHDNTVYPDHELTERDGTATQRDIVLQADVAKDITDFTNGLIAPTQMDSVWITDVTDPSRPVVRERWQFPPPKPLDVAVPGQGWNHEAQLVDGDPTLMVVTEESPFDPCTGRVFLVRLSDDLTESTTLAKWYVPGALRLFDIGLWADAPGCMHHVFSTDDGLLFMSNAGAAGDWVIDLRPLRAVRTPRTPKARPLQPHEDGIPWLEEYFPAGNKPEVGHYIHDSNATSWTAVHRDGLIYTTGGSLPPKPRGLDVFRFEPPR